MKRRDELIEEPAAVSYLRYGGVQPFAVHAMGFTAATQAAALEKLYQEYASPASWWWATSNLRIWWLTTEGGR